MSVIIRVEAERRFIRWHWTVYEGRNKTTGYTLTRRGVENAIARHLRLIEHIGAVDKALRLAGPISTSPRARRSASGGRSVRSDQPSEG